MADQANPGIKRSQVLFVILVGAVLFTAYLAERSTMDDPAEKFSFARPNTVTFDPLRPPFGEFELRGVVLAPGGAPAAEAQVSLLREGAPAHGAEPLAWTFTDAAGRFELLDLKEGDYRAVLVQPGHPPTTRHLTIPAEGSVILELEPPLKPVVPLPPLTRTRLSGRVSTPLGMGLGAAADYEVVLRPTGEDAPLSGAVVRRTPTDENGAYAFNDVVVANYHVEVLPPWARTGGYPVLARTRLTAVGDALAPRLDLELQNAGLVGQIFDHNGVPLEGALVKVWRADEDEERAWPPVPTDADGAFRFSDLVPGDYRVRARAAGAESEARVRAERGTYTPVGLPVLDTRRRQ